MALFYSHITASSGNSKILSSAKFLADPTNVKRFCAKPSCLWSRTTSRLRLDRTLRSTATRLRRSQTISKIKTTLTVARATPRSRKPGRMTCALFFPVSMPVLNLQVTGTSRTAFMLSTMSNNLFVRRIKADPAPCKAVVDAWTSRMVGIKPTSPSAGVRIRSLPRWLSVLENLKPKRFFQIKTWSPSTSLDTHSYRKCI